MSGIHPDHIHLQGKVFLNVSFDMFFFCVNVHLLQDITSDLTNFRSDVPHIY